MLGALFLFPLPLKGRLLKRTAAHTTRRCDGGQECCERGYYYLHQRLDDFALVHGYFFFSLR